MARYFVYDGREQPDPDPSKTPEQVRDMLADFLPELHNADISKTERDGNEYYDLRRKVGTKGQR